MELELIVGDADEVDGGVDAAESGANGGEVVGVPGDEFGERIGAEGGLEFLLVAAENITR